ncbi:hypothetical protein BG004_002435 [Podila humilis]|nr:hypothetical protein BG004_002435 [Podila humilis]
MQPRIRRHQSTLIELDKQAWKQPSTGAAFQPSHSTRLNSHDMSPIPQAATTLSDPPPPISTRTQPHLTYQEQDKVAQRLYFPELEPAPFPNDIQSCMPYLNRDVRTRKTDENGTIHGSHNDLSSFEGLDHNTKSTIYRGTLFEYQTQEILKKTLGIHTQRSAGNNDLGVDLRGTWFVPLSASPKPGDKVRHLKVIVQCKVLRGKVGPKFVRELQGSLSFETQPTMAILAVSSDFTKHALLPYAKSIWPMALVVIDAENHQCRKLMWNRAADKVMHGLHVGTKWIKGENGMESWPVLCFEGKPLERLPGPYLRRPVEVVQDTDIDEFSLSIDAIDLNKDRPEYLDILPSANEAVLMTEESEDVLPRETMPLDPEWHSRSHELSE